MRLAPPARAGPPGPHLLDRPRPPPMSIFETFFGDEEVAPEPVSSITGKATDGLGGYVE